MVLNYLSSRVIGLAMKVHSALGPGLLETVYEACLEHELRENGFFVQRQALLMIHYQNVQVDGGFRVDLLVERQLIVELKAVDRILPIHEAQLITYLKLSDLSLGLLINFNVVHLREGIRRLANKFAEQ
jgi:GxxExxY protein